MTNNNTQLLAKLPSIPNRMGNNNQTNMLLCMGEMCSPQWPLFPACSCVHRSAKIFQPNQCAQCRQRLDLPAVHFMCGDSFHAQCLANDKECPICTPEFQKVCQPGRTRGSHRM